MAVKDLKIVSMTQTADDFDVNVNPVQTDYLRIYDEVRDYACRIAEAEEAIGRKVIVDMGRTYEGFPIADLYRNGIVFRKIFATEDLNNGDHERFDCASI